VLDVLLQLLLRLSTFAKLLPLKFNHRIHGIHQPVKRVLLFACQLKLWPFLLVQIIRLYDITQ